MDGADSRDGPGRRSPGSEGARRHGLRQHREVREPRLDRDAVPAASCGAPACAASRATTDPASPARSTGSAYRETLEYAAELGQKYTGLAWWPGPYNQEALWHQLADHLNQAAELADEYDLQFFYHNHDFEFLNRFGDRAAYDILLEETESNVKFQLDLFWVTEGGGNGVEYLSADPGRYVSYHVKDHVWGDRLNAADFEDAGPGMLDFPDLFDAGDGRNGRYDKYYFIEHDEPALSHPGDPEAPLTTARVGIEYLRNVSW